jgi:hypothetical protein
MGRDGAAYEVIWVRRERKYFSKQGWTGYWPESLSGKSVDLGATTRLFSNEIVAELAGSPHERSDMPG